jgi:hypothetical protein
MWTFDRAANYMRYSLVCPEGISQMRWLNMIRQVRNVYGNGWLTNI